MHHKYPTIDIVSFMDSNFANWRLEDKFSLALLIATTAHFKQYDKGGNPYITHPMRIMMRLRTTDKELMQIAILHDVVEDTLVTFEDLKILGFSDRVISALNVLTKDNTISYEKNIDRVLTNIDACKVKLEDLKDNLDNDFPFNNDHKHYMMEGSDKFQNKKILEWLNKKANI